MAQEPEISKWSNTQAVREVECPRCFAKPGTYCKTPAGRPAQSTHGERSGAYLVKIGREEWDKRHTGSMASSALLQKGRIDQIISGTKKVNVLGSGQNTTGTRARWRVTPEVTTEVTEVTGTEVTIPKVTED
jgi:hypothetical protein